MFQAEWGLARDVRKAATHRRVDGCCIVIAWRNASCSGSKHWGNARTANCSSQRSYQTHSSVSEFIYHGFSCNQPYKSHRSCQLAVHAASHRLTLIVVSWLNDQRTEPCQTANVSPVVAQSTPHHVEDRAEPSNQSRPRARKACPYTQYPSLLLFLALDEHGHSRSRVETPWYVSVCCTAIAAPNIARDLFLVSLFTPLAHPRIESH